MAKLVSKTYGEALFELGVEEHSMEELTEETKAVLQAMEENPDLMKLLNHPKIGKEEKVSVMENIFKGQVSDTMVGFLVLVVQKDRYNELAGILEYFLDKVREEKKIGVASVCSAVPLSDTQKSQIKNKLLETTEYVDFEMEFHVDQTLIGGLVIRVGDRVVDSSIRSRIDTLAKELSKIQLNEIERKEGAHIS